MDVARCPKSAESYRLDRTIAGSILTQGKQGTDPWKTLRAACHVERSKAESKHLRLLSSLRLMRHVVTISSMLKDSYFTYIVANRSHTLYVGVTGDLHKRIFQHKWKEHDGFSGR